MKIRNGFVSNSSSSSFIVIGTKPPVNPLPPNRNHSPLYVNGDFANGEFGWGPDILDTWNERVAFAFIIAHNSPSAVICNERMEMMERVMKDQLKIHHIEWPIDLRYGFGTYWYIDHASAENEKPENARMFKDEDTLRHWLFSPDSAIHLDNDNH